MDQNHQNLPGAVPNDSAGFRNVPKASESFRSLPHPSEPFGTVPTPSERKENHTLTVRDAARMFEAAGVARTERSIVNWCQQNRNGIARLDSYFDPNERKYYLTAESVERAIQEEIQKAAKINAPSEGIGSVPKPSESPKTPAASSEGDGGRLRELEKENLDLKIVNKGKDFLIEQLQKERDGFFGQLMESSRKVGELETRLLQLEGPKQMISPDGD